MLLASESIAKSIANKKLLCEKLDGTLTQFFTLQEDIFDFQFQLVDSLAAVTRGVIAKRFAKRIRGKYASLQASEVMTRFLMSQVTLQVIWTVYCDTLEYQNNGKTVDVCTTDNNGLYR